MRVVAVASGKGGVGKTWFSITLGQALARMNMRVLLVDCDLGLANIDVQLGVDQGIDIMRVVMGEVALPRAIKRIEAINMDVLSGRSGGGHPGGLDPLMVGWLQRALSRLCDDYDMIVMDLPSGIEQGVRDLMRHADERIVVTTSEPTALTDAYALIKAMRRVHSAAASKIVVNFAEDGSTGRQTLQGLARVCDRFLSIKPQALGVIRRDRRVAECICRQVPLLQCYPGSEAAQDVIAIAEALARQRSAA